MCPWDWPKGTIVATRNPVDDDDDNGDAMSQCVCEFAGQWDEHSLDLLSITL